MPKDRESPFTPGQPAPQNLFVGRIEQIRHFEKKIARAGHGRLEVVFLGGERGIGKTSLAKFVRYVVAERDHQMVGLHLLLAGVTSLREMVRRTFEGLATEGIATQAPWYQRIKDFFGEYVKRVDLFGVEVEFRPPEDHLQGLVHNFLPAMHNLTQRLQEEERKGIFLILDDINGLAASVDFANWLKSFVDEVAISQKSLPMCLVLVGLEEHRQTLIRLQPSLARIIDPLEIHAWSDDETRKFYQKAFSEVEIDIEDKALETMAYFAGGLPAVAHIIGDVAFDLDEDYYIDATEANKAVVIAADQVGRKYLEPQVLSELHSKRYRKILRWLAQAPYESRFRRREVLQHLKAKGMRQEAQVLDNFLRRIERLGVIKRDPEGGRGTYRFTKDIYRLYLLLEAARAKAEEEEMEIEVL